MTMTPRPPRLIPSRRIVECICFRRPCKHEREADAEYAIAKLEADQRNALTADDWEWLRSVGWRG